MMILTIEKQVSIHIEKRVTVGRVVSIDLLNQQQQIVDNDNRM